MFKIYKNAYQKDISYNWIGNLFPKAKYIGLYAILGDILLFKVDGKVKKVSENKQIVIL